MEIFLTHSRMKLLMDQSCTVVHHHHCHRTPTWNWRRKEKLKTVLLPTHTELQRLHQLGFPTPFLEQNSSCPATLCWAICLTAAPAHCQKHSTDQYLGSRSVYQSLCTRITGVVTCSLGVRASRMIAEGSSAVTALWHKPLNFKNKGQIDHLCRSLAQCYRNLNSSPEVLGTHKKKGEGNL